MSKNCKVHAGLKLKSVKFFQDRSSLVLLYFSISLQVQLCNLQEGIRSAGGK